MLLVPRGHAGAVRAARRAGTYPASAADANRNSEAPANTAGSVALTSYSREPATPIATPAPPSIRARPTTMRSIRPRSAPNAMRTPISCVRRATEYEMTP